LSAPLCPVHGEPADRLVCPHLAFGHGAGVNPRRGADWCDGCQALGIARGAGAPEPTALCARCHAAALARNRSPRFELAVDERTLLRTPTRDDARPIFALVEANRAYLRRWLPWVDGSTAEEHTRAFLDFSIAAGLDGRSLVLVIEHDGTLAGTAGFNSIDPRNRTCEIGYWLRADFQGRGIVSGACRALVRHAFGSLALNCVRLAAATENAKSRAVPERLGFHLDGVLREQEWVDGRFVDHAVYTLLRREWRGGASAGSAS
jgi:ribosomal-protein-serine acetyltransferase